MYKYETHLHTYPVSKCAKVGVRETLAFYKKMDYDGVFITNHFLDGNINMDKSLPYAEKLTFFCSDYEEAKKLADDVGIKVFFGVELSCKGTDFLVYGLEPAWFYAHPEIMDMRKSEELRFLMESGALVIQAHPFREAAYIDHIRLFPRCVHGVETVNGCRTEFENKMAAQYAKDYGLLSFAGSDNHTGAAQKLLAGMCAETPLADEQDFVRRIHGGEMQIFTLPGCTQNDF